MTDKELLQLCLQAFAAIIKDYDEARIIGQRPGRSVLTKAKEMSALLEQHLVEA